MKEVTEQDLKKTQLDILNTVAAFCEKENINYVLFYGTLLGAVRHHGFIPWDDDVDIAMPREDYKRFMDSFPMDKYLCLCNEKDRTFPYSYGKVNRLDTKLIEVSDLTYDLGINIDIFPIDGIAAPGLKQTLLNCRLNILKKFYLSKTVKVTAKRKWYRNLILFFIKCVTYLISYQSILKRIAVLSQKYPYNKSDWCGILTDPDITHLNHYMLKEYFSTSIYMEFEECKFKVPGNYDAVLSHLYGDHMQLPPPEQRVSQHAFSAYWHN